MTIARAWYVRCDGPCGGSPAEIAVESTEHAVILSRRQGYVAKKVNGRIIDLCPACQQKEKP